MQIDTFCEDIYEQWLDISEYDECAINIIAHYSVIAEVLDELMHSYEEFSIFDINLCPVEINGYNKEYIMSIEWDGKIWIQELWNDHLNEYYSLESTDIHYINEYCNSAIVSKNKDCSFEEFCICDGDCENCDHFNDEPEETDTKQELTKNNKSLDIEDDMHGFSANWDDDGGYHHYSFYSSDQDMVKEMLKLFK